jgi:hypothetical protein
MQDYATGFGAIAFIVGILLVGLSGNRGMRLRFLVFSVGALLVLVGTAAELAALLVSRANG